MSKQCKNRIFLTTEMSEVIRKKRSECNLSQKDIAKKINITSKKYSKYETREVTSIETDILFKILNALDLEMEDITKRLDSRCSFSISQDMKNELDFLKELNKLDTISDTVKYCIRFTLDNYYKNKISVSLLEEIKEVINVTYNEQIQKMSLDVETKNLILETMNNNCTYELNQLQEQVKRLFLNYSHVKRE